MGKSNTLEAAMLALIFHGTAIADIAQNHATPVTMLTVALHTADPGEAGTQSTNEIAYTGYARIAVARNASGWAISGSSISPVVNIDFGEMVGGAGGTVTHLSVGTGVSDAMLYSGALTPNINVINGVIPRIKTTSTITED